MRLLHKTGYQNFIIQYTFHQSNHQIAKFASCAIRVSKILIFELINTIQSAAIVLK